ncbi:acrB [Candida metapsilosis]|uniref:AcrB n=1 Tax=Candida metapsilosis TaxID=273372 RepID=A0A8H7ZBN5_9ASCO|nr:acrB [Candida metapsilosis]
MHPTSTTVNRKSRSSSSVTSQSQSQSTSTSTGNASVSSSKTSSSSSSRMHGQSQPTSFHHHYHLNGKNGVANSTQVEAVGDRRGVPSTNVNKVNNAALGTPTAVEHHHHYHHHHHHHPQPSSVFPNSSSLRDILSLIFVTLSLPQSVSLLICILYLVLGSNFMGGKFLINFMLPNSQKRGFRGIKSISYSEMKVVLIDSIVYLTLVKFIKKKSYFNYLIMLSKSIVSSELIGASSIYYINSISNKKITSKIQYDDRRRTFFNSSLMNAILCFIIINYINYLLNWFHFASISINPSSTTTNNTALAASTAVASLKSFNNLATKIIPINISYINNLNFTEYKIQLYLFLSIHIINRALFVKKSAIVQNSIPNINEEISINVDENKLMDIEVDLNQVPSKNNSNTTIAYRNFENFVVSPFNSKLTNLKNRMRAASLSRTKLGSSNVAGLSSYTLGAAPNAIGSPSANAPMATPPPIFAPAPVTNSTAAAGASAVASAGASAVASSSSSSLPTPPTSITTSSKLTPVSKSLTTTTISPNITVIENTIIIQPFWSIVAACKAILKNPNLFIGEPTRKTVDSEEFDTGDIESQDLPIAVVAIDSSTVVLKLLFHEAVENLKIRLNNVNWSYFKLGEESGTRFITIYGLTPLFQYEVEIFDRDVLLNHFLINTTNDDDQIINKSSGETSSLVTLQTSLTSTMTNLNNLKLKLKKFKKDENKKISDLKNSIDVVKNKISKYNDAKPVNENRVFGKIQGLKHSVSQLENEIESIQSDIDTLTQEEESLHQQSKAKEQAQLEEIKRLELEYTQYETRLKEYKSNLIKLQQEQGNLSTKYQKLVARYESKQEELKTIQIELKNLKKGEILSKFAKRIKKTNEKFDTIIPRILHETDLLRQECKELMDE